MKALFKHFALIILLVLHTSWGSVMAAQMQTMHFNMGNSESTVSEQATKSVVKTIDNMAQKPCPHHTMMVDSTKTGNLNAMTQCHGHDCSNCDCVNVLSSVLPIMVSLTLIHDERSIVSAFIPAVFPDSPPSFILRPPIS